MATTVLIELVRNSGCSVSRREDGALVSDTVTGTWENMWGVTSIGSGLVGVLLALAAPVVGVRALLPAVGLLGLTYVLRRALRDRRPRLGVFVVDDRGVERAGSLRPWSDIAAIALQRDWLDWKRVDVVPPLWLAVEGKDGTWVYVAKGRRSELEPLLETFERHGLRP